MQNSDESVQSGAVVARELNFLKLLCRLYIEIAVSSAGRDTIESEKETEHGRHLSVCIGLMKRGY